MHWLFKQKASCAIQVNQKQRPTKWGRKVTLTILLVLITLWSWQKIHAPETFPIRSVKIIDNGTHIDQQLLKATILPFLTRGMLWLNETQLQQALLKMPWVADTQIKREWPDQLIITLIEPVPIAHWNNQNLLTQHGTVFNSGNVTLPDNLPWLFGPDNQQQTVWAGYQAMDQLLSPMGLSITAAALSSRQAWEIRLNNGWLLLLGQEDVLTRLNRFISVYPQLLKQSSAEQPAYIDLRYSNGFAVKWQPIVQNNQ